MSLAEACAAVPSADVPPELRTIARATDYAEFAAAIRDRIESLNVSRAEVDYDANLQDGYISKLTSRRPSRGFGKKSLGNVLRTLGLVILLAEDVQATEQIRRTLAQRKRKNPIATYLSEIGRKGGEARRQNAARG